MFFRTIHEKIKLSLTIPQYSEEIFSLVHQNRNFLKQWLSWIDSTQQVSDTKSFIESELIKFQKGEALHETIFYEDKIVGVLGFNWIDQKNKIGHLGYWISEKYSGKGIMTLAVQDLIQVGVDYFQMQRIEIRCAISNKKSRAIPERLGFKQEGVIRQAEFIQGSYLDHCVYGYLPSIDQKRAFS